MCDYECMYDYIGDYICEYSYMHTYMYMQIFIYGKYCVCICISFFMCHHIAIAVCTSCAMTATRTEAHR